MRVIRLLLAMLPLGYVGWLLFVFVRPALGNGEVTDAALLPNRLIDSGLGPTVLGLGIIGLLFCIPVLFRAVMLFLPSASVPIGGAVTLAARMAARAGPRAGREEPAFDADAALDRYLARKGTDQDEVNPPRTEREPVAAVAKPSFGRKRG